MDRDMKPVNITCRRSWFEEMLRNVITHLSVFVCRRPEETFLQPADEQHVSTKLSYLGRFLCCSFCV